LDLLGNGFVEIEWIAREQNVLCDQLARGAVSAGQITLSIAPEFSEQFS
jgi:ribonuclease HI